MQEVRKRSKKQTLSESNWSLIFQFLQYITWTKKFKKFYCANERNNKRVSYSEYTEAATQRYSRKGVLKIRSKFTGEHPCRSVISIKLLCNFIEIALRHGCSPLNLQHIFRTPFCRNTCGWLLPNISVWSSSKSHSKYHLLL